MTVPAQPTLLDGVRVVELGAEISAPFAGKLLADAGADAIKIEPLGGDPARRMAPFATDEPHRETSTVFLQYNTSKRGVALDIESRAGQRVLRAPAVRASRQPGLRWVARRGPPGPCRSPVALRDDLRSCHRAAARRAFPSSRVDVRRRVLAQASRSACR